MTEAIRRKELRRGETKDMTWAVAGAIHVTLETELCHPERELGHDGLRRILHLDLQGFRSGTEEGAREEGNETTGRVGSAVDDLLFFV